MMTKSSVLDISRKFIAGIFPLLVVGLANLASMAHFKHFCILKMIIGYDCWGCGLTRAVAALGRLEFYKAYEYNHRVIIIVPLLLLLWAFWLKKEFFEKSVV